MAVDLLDVGARLTKLEGRHNRLQARVALLEFVAQYLFTTLERTNDDTDGSFRKSLVEVLETVVSDAAVADELRAAAREEIARWKTPTGHREARRLD